MTRLERLRNIGISAHIDSGKTTLAERILFYCGRIHEIHEVRGSDGVGATMDSDPIEKKRGITIQSALTSVDWADHVLQIIDTPGHVDFTVEVERSLRVLDGAILVLCSVGGVQSQTLTVDRQMRRYGVPAVAFINKMDRTGANHARVVEQLRTQLRRQVVLLQLPMGSGPEFRGVINLLTMHAITFEGVNGERVVRGAIPAEYQEDARQARRSLLETLAMQDDACLEAMLSGDEPTLEQLHGALRRSVLAEQLTPVLLGSAACNQGVQELLDAVVHYLPSPLDRQVEALDLRQLSSPTGLHSELPKLTLSVSEDAPAVAMAYKTACDDFGTLTFLRVYQGRIERGQVYVNVRTGKRHRFAKLVRLHADQRTEIEFASAGDLCGVVGLESAMGDTFVKEGYRVAMENIHVPEPVIRMAIEPQRRDDIDRLAKALDRFRRQDPTFQYWSDTQTGQTIIAGMGQLHLEVAIQRLKDDHDCQITVGKPQVTYLERPTRAVTFEHRLKKQTGGPGQFAQIAGRVEPMPMDAETDFEFVNEVVGGRISRSFIPAIEQGVRDALIAGPLGQFRVIGVRLVLTDGMEHEKDSSEHAFRRCAWEAMRNEVLPKAAMELLEPVMHLDVEVAREHQGAVTGDLTRRRGHIEGCDEVDGLCRLQACVPLAEVLDYANQLRSLTQGQGTFTLSPAGYQAVPLKLVNELLADRKKSA